MKLLVIHYMKIVAKHMDNHFFLGIFYCLRWVDWNEVVLGWLVN